MRTRSIPFGYEVVGGRYVVNNGEAEIISSIYNMYLSGKTLLGIAEVLTEQETTYFEDTKVWNKNMVSRILADERYLGNEAFPRLVDSNNFNLAKNIRADKGGKKAVLTPLMTTVKNMLYCAECGETFAVDAAIAAFTKGENWLDALRAYIHKNRQTVTGFLESNLSELKPVSAEATYLLWIDCSAVTDDSVGFTEFLRREAGLYLSDGAEYGETGRKFVRMNIACPISTLRDGLSRLKTGTEKYKDSRLK